MARGTATLEMLQKTPYGLDGWSAMNPRIDFKRLYGKKQMLRHLDPGMDEVLAWGEYDPPVKNDFTCSKGAFQEKYKINKMGVEFISEKQDNFRDPVLRETQPKEEQIVDYVQKENQNVIKKKIFNNLVDKDHMECFSTEYRQEMGKNGEGKCWHAIDEDPPRRHGFFDNVTAAGKTRYLSKPKPGTEIVMPMEFKNQ